MEESASRVTRSRSRSKTPFLRSTAVDHAEDDLQQEAATTSRRTPVRRTTPIKRRRESAEVRERAAPIVEEEESPPARRTRAAVASTASTASTQHARAPTPSKETAHALQNNHLNHVLVAPSTVREYHEQVREYHERERVSTTSASASAQRGRVQVFGLTDLSLSPIAQDSLNLQQRAHRNNASTGAFSNRAGSCSAHSTCSTDSSFAEVALANCSDELARNPSREHLPSRLYIAAGDYCNKYPKTDFTYSRLSRDRVELAPGQVAVPNMSRRSLEHFRREGPLHAPPTASDEPDFVYTTAMRNTCYQRYESSDDEGYAYAGSKRLRSRGSSSSSERWWMTRMLLALYSSLTSSLTAVSSSLASSLAAAASSLASPFTGSRSQAARLRARRHSSTQGAGLVRSGAALAAAPFYWIYTIIKTIITTTVTTVTETMSWSEAPERRGARYQKRSRRWPWLLALLLPLLAYGSLYAYENRSALSNLPIASKLSLPNFTLPDINLTMPDLPDIELKLPDLPESMVKMRDSVQDRISDATGYLRQVADSCWEEMGRYWAK